MKFFVTGSAGFIGYHFCLKLLRKGHIVFSIDNFDSYYDTNLKKDRIKILKNFKNFNFRNIDLVEKKKINSIIKKNNIKIIIHLAAQAGVRLSINFPKKYFNSNLKGFFNILEIAKENKLRHLLFASSSSVYGDNDFFPLKENHLTNKPISFYAATKMSNELMAFSYSNIHKIPITSMRFFTVYGSYGRPDMAIHKFTNLILKKKKISLYEYGKNYRDFTHINDISEMIYKLVKKPSKKFIPFNCFNLGYGKPVTSAYLCNLIQKKLKCFTKVELIPKQLGDVTKTHADTSLINRYIKYKPKIKIENGIDEFLNWYKAYYLE